MKRKACLAFLLIATIVAAFSASIKIGKAQTPTIYVNPVSKTVLIGDQFSIDINLNHAENLYGYEVWLSFDNTILNATSIAYANFLNDPHLIWYQLVNNTGGYVTIAVSSLNPATGKTGGFPPPLANVTFQAIGFGGATLHLYNTKMGDDQGFVIPHETTDGQITVFSEDVHDLAITSIETSKVGCLPKETVGRGKTMGVNVTTVNQGGFLETFNITIYANSTAMIEAQVTLNSMQTAIQGFTLDTSDLPYGAYTLSAEADTVPGETDIADNLFIGGTIFVTIAGDVDGDKDVDIYDIVRLAGTYGASKPDPRYDPNCDLDDDGDIDIFDIVIGSGNYGKSW